MFLVRGDDAVDLGLGLAHELARVDGLVELGALGRGDVDEDLGRVAQVLAQLVEVALVALLYELTAALHGKGPGVVEGVLHVVTQGGTLKGVGGLAKT